MVLLGLVVHPGDQRANSVDYSQVALLRLLKVFRRGPVGGEYNQRARRHLVHGVHGDRSLSLQGGNHMGIVHNLVFDVHRGAKPLEAKVYNLDCPYHSGAKSSWGTEKNFQVHSSWYQTG
jgi:hypothetical protein